MDYPRQPDLIDRVRRLEEQVRMLRLRESEVPDYVWLGDYISDSWDAGVDESGTTTAWSGFSAHFWRDGNIIYLIGNIVNVSEFFDTQVTRLPLPVGYRPLKQTKWRVHTDLVNTDEEGMGVSGMLHINTAGHIQWGNQFYDASSDGSISLLEVPRFCQFSLDSLYYRVDPELSEDPDFN